MEDPSSSPSHEGHITTDGELQDAHDLEFTGECFVPGVHGNIELEHLHRYLQACEIAEDKIVLDIASGEGYGSFMLSDKAAMVTGVDISDEAVNHARAKYGRSNLRYLVGTCADIPLPDFSVDLVVSFETIEHHDEHEAMMLEIKRVLRPNGSLLISSPDKLRYSIEPNHTNPFHVKELYGNEFKDLVDRHFRNSTFFGQRVLYGSSILPDASVTPSRCYWKNGDESGVSSGDNRPLYWIALASDGELPTIAAGVFEQPIDSAEAVVAYRAALAERDGQVADFSGRLATREGELADLSGRLATREGELADLSGRLATREDDLTNMATGLADREDQIASLRETHANLSQSLAEKRDQLNSQEEIIDAAQREIARLMAMADELRAIKGSTLMRLRAAVKEESFGFHKLAHVAHLSLSLVLAQFRRRSPVATAGANTGRIEERPSPSAALESAAHGFDPDFYLAQYPDVAAAGVDPLDHYLRHGQAEGRLPRSPGLTGGPLLEFALPAQAENYRPLVSIIVPTYNHGEFIEERLESIYRQTYDGPVEVYLLDDASSDCSPRVLQSFADRFPTITTLITNSENSGSAFRQWRRGLALVRGDIVWIAESDDLCDRDFLETLVPLMANPAVMLAFSRTVFFRDTTRHVVLTLEDYLHDVGPFRFDIPWIQPGAALGAAGFAEKNLVPNVSGAVFRHPRSMPFLDSDEWLDMRLAGDWIFYLEIIKSGLVAYSPATTNYHRSTDTTLTSQINASSSVLAQEIAQAKATAHRLYRTGSPADRTTDRPTLPLASIADP
jgi:SAM-dependent methyltransferase